MTSLSPASRFQILDRPLLRPGKCACCGASDKRVVVFGAKTREYGTIYLCFECLTEGAMAIGMVPEHTLRDNSQETSEIVDSYLFQHNLKAIPDELYLILYRLVELHDSWKSNVVVSTATEGSVDNEKSIGAGNIAPVGNDEINDSRHDAIVYKGPDSVSDGFSF